MASSTGEVFKYLEGLLNAQFNFPSFVHEFIFLCVFVDATGI